MKKILTLILAISTIITPLLASSHSHPSHDLLLDRNVQSNVSPNPSRAATTIRLSNNNDTFSVEVYDLIGNPIGSYDNSYTADKTKVSFDVSDWADGMYFYYIIQNDKRIATGRMVVRH